MGRGRALFRSPGCFSVRGKRRRPSGLGGRAGQSGLWPFKSEMTLAVQEAGRGWPAAEPTLELCFPGQEKRGKEEKGAPLLAARAGRLSRRSRSRRSRGPSWRRWPAGKSLVAAAGAEHAGVEEGRGAGREPRAGGGVSAKVGRTRDAPRPAPRSAPPQQRPPLPRTGLELERRRRRRLWLRRALLAAFCNGPRDAETPAAHASRSSHDRG